MMRMMKMMRLCLFCVQMFLLSQLQLFLVSAPVEEENRRGTESPPHSVTSEAANANLTTHIISMLKVHKGQMFKLCPKRVQKNSPVDPENDLGRASNESLGR